MFEVLSLYVSFIFKESIHRYLVFTTINPPQAINNIRRLVSVVLCSHFEATELSTQQPKTLGIGIVDTVGKILDAFALTGTRRR